MNKLCHKYIQSGWAFLIPYLCSYLLYAWQGWPVNINAESRTAEIQLFPLIRVYWILHFFHAAVLLVFIFGLLRPKPDGYRKEDKSEFIYSLIPWFCLALIFWLPGIYLEWPADSWEHLRRINGWRAVEEVTNHVVWTKSSYFLPYSLTGILHPANQIKALNIFYTISCLLLSWQYFRLGRCLGLSQKSAFVFILLNAVLFGNSIFSFYRYYGLSSSIFAQIGMVALTRLIVDSVHRPNRINSDAVRQATPWISLGDLPPLRRMIPAMICLLTLIGFNHVQGLALAALALAAIALWRISTHRPTLLPVIALAVGACSIATYWWFPRHPALQGVFLTEGWLNDWLGFNLLDPGSPSWNRSLQILGSIGLVNLLAGVILISRNRLIGWLTVLPLAALLLPCFSIPLAHLLASRGNPVDNIVVFHRMLFAIPAGLALVSCGEFIMHKFSKWAHDEKRQSLCWTPAGFSSVVTLCSLGLFGMLALPTHAPFFNRLWHSFHIPPADLSLSELVETLPPNAREGTEGKTPFPIFHTFFDQVGEAFYPSKSPVVFRDINGHSTIAMLEHRLSWFGITGRPPGYAFQSLLSQTPSARNQSQIRMVRAPANLPRLHDLTTPESSWIELQGNRPRTSASGSKLVVQNESGLVSHPFTKDFIPVSASQRFSLSSSIRHQGPEPALCFLAVAWYDKSFQLLPSNISSPTGSGQPQGWVNGTYSYYGLVNQPAASDWTKYQISFGWGESKQIPSNAAFIRVGALLNQSATPQSWVELTDVILREQLLPAEVLLFTERKNPGYAHESLAGRLSGHWLPHHLAKDHAGEKELTIQSQRFFGPPRK